MNLCAACDGAGYGSACDASGPPCCVCGDPSLLLHPKKKKKSRRPHSHTPRSIQLACLKKKRARACQGDSSCRRIGLVGCCGCDCASNCGYESGAFVCCGRGCVCMCDLRTATQHYYPGRRCGDCGSRRWPRQASSHTWGHAWGCPRATSSMMPRISNNRNTSLHRYWQGTRISGVRTSAAAGPWRVAAVSSPLLRAAHRLAPASPHNSSHEACPGHPARTPCSNRRDTLQLASAAGMNSLYARTATGHRSQMKKPLTVAVWRRWDH